MYQAHKSPADAMALGLSIKKEVESAVAGAKATLLPGTSVACHLHFNASLACVGGVRGLIPLFAMLVDPSDLDPRNRPCRLTGTTVLEPTEASELLVHLLALLPT